MAKSRGNTLKGREPKEPAERERFLCHAHSPLRTRGGVYVLLVTCPLNIRKLTGGRFSCQLDKRTVPLSSS